MRPQRTRTQERLYGELSRIRCGRETPRALLQLSKPPHHPQLDPLPASKRQHAKYNALSNTYTSSGRVFWGSPPHLLDHHQPAHLRQSDPRKRPQPETAGEECLRDERFAHILRRRFRWNAAGVEREGGGAPGDAGAQSQGHLEYEPETEGGGHGRAKIRADDYGGSGRFRPQLLLSTNEAARLHVGSVPIANPINERFSRVLGPRSSSSINNLCAGPKATW